MSRTNLRIDVSEFVAIAAQDLSLWEHLVGGDILHLDRGLGQIISVEPRHNYVPLISVRFEEKICKWPPVSFSNGKSTFVAASSEQYSTLRRRMDDILELRRLAEIRHLAEEAEKACALIARKAEEARAYAELEKQLEEEERKFAAQEKRERRVEKARMARSEARRIIEEEEWRRTQESLRAIRSAEIEADAVRKGVKQLVHFTPVKNVSSILNRGIMSRDRLGDQEFMFTDEYRADGWLDWISVSVSFPNYKMFYQKKMNSELAGDWAIMLISREVLWSLDCRFIFTNASRGSIRQKPEDSWGTSEAFGEMFAHPRQRHNLPEAYATDPQAEVMVKSHIPESFILGVAVESRNVEAQLLNEGVSRIRVMPELFRPRCDFEYWKNNWFDKPDSEHSEE